MSASAIKAWRTLPIRRALLDGARQLMPEKRRPTIEAMELVGLTLCVMHRKGDCIDDTHAQIQSELVSLSADQVARSLQALDHPALFPILVRGAKGQGTKRRIAFLRLMGANPNEIVTTTHGDSDNNSWGYAPELMGVRTELMGSNPDTPKETPKENLKVPPKESLRDALAQEVSGIAMRFDGELTKNPLQSPGARKRRQANYVCMALDYFAKNDSPLGASFPTHALGEYLAAIYHRLQPSNAVTTALHDWHDYDHNVQHTPTCTKCNDTGHVFSGDLRNPTHCECAKGETVKALQQEKRETHT